MIRNFKLETKFSLLLMLIFFVGVLISGTALSRVLEHKAQDEVADKALILIQAMDSVRDYTSGHIEPLLTPRLDTDPEFIPETVPAYSATEVFDNFRKNEEYKTFFYKEATLNPTNLRDKADSFETEIVERFRQETDNKEITGFRSLFKEKVFYIARPLAIKEESCLRCHSTPEAAPKSQLETYGRENGFGWKLNEIVAAQIISVPATKVFDTAHRALSLIMAVLISTFAIVVILTNFFLRRAVVKPIKKMARMAQEVSLGNMEAEFQHKSKDEIGSLAAAFNRMKTSLEISLKLLNDHND